jgi:hypothetical protein
MCAKQAAYLQRIVSPSPMPIGFGHKLPNLTEPMKINTIIRSNGNLGLYEVCHGVNANLIVIGVNKIDVKDRVNQLVEYPYQGLYRMWMTEPAKSIVGQDPVLMNWFQAKMDLYNVESSCKGDPRPRRKASSCTA